MWTFIYWTAISLVCLVVGFWLYVEADCHGWRPFFLSPSRLLSRFRSWRCVRTVNSSRRQRGSSGRAALRRSRTAGIFALRFTRERYGDGPPEGRE